MRRLVQMGLVAVLLCVANAAAAGPTLFELAGQWRGVGLVRDDMAKPLREGRCRLTATPLEEGREVRLQGRCATARGSAEFSMRFVLFAGGVVAGGIASSLRPKSVQFVGRIEGAQTTLHSRAPVDVEDRRGISVIVLKVEDETHFSLRQSLKVEKTGVIIDLMQMAFSKWVQ